MNSENTGSGPGLLNSHPPPRPDKVPRGLLPTPPVVADLVAREEARLPMAAEARQRVIDTFNLQYYCGGQTVAYRHTPQGVEVLAVGPEEIGHLVKTMGADERREVILGQPESWW